MAHPVMVTWIIAKDNYTVGVSTIKTVKHKRFSGTVTSVKKIVVEFMMPNV